MENDYDELTIVLRDPENQLVKMIDHIMHTANIGHSYEVVVDPGDSDYEKKFFMDGDGSFFIESVKKNKKKVEVKDDKLIEYLNIIQKD